MYRYNIEYLGWMFLLGAIFLRPLTACVVSLISRRLLWGGSWAFCPAQWSLQPPATQSHTPTHNSVCFTSTLEGFSKPNEYAKRGGENINKQQQ